MKAPANRQLECTHLPVLSSREQGWGNILVEQFQLPAGEARFDQGDEHAIYLSLASRPVHLLQVQGGKTYAGLYGKGDISIMPAQVPLFSR
jgi:AraC family transcriptional regulator